MILIIKILIYFSFHLENKNLTYTNKKEIKVSSKDEDKITIEKETIQLQADDIIDKTIKKNFVKFRQNI